MSIYIGLMSGTSMDGIDAVAVSFEANESRFVNSTSIDIPSDLKSLLSSLMRNEGSINQLGEADTKLGHLFADAVDVLLKKINIAASEITAIGSHGQTIYHQPNHKHPFTLQIGDPNIIAARTNITTVADFRRRDIALGGQGAPLVPAFHAYLFGRKNEWVLNIGGIANLTYLPNDPAKSIMGFDTGPGNTLLDLWHEKHRKNPVDLNGDWARTGILNNALLTLFLEDPYFKKSPPKSTGREYFHLNWLEEKLKNLPENIRPEDIQATLTELTAKSIADAIDGAKSTAKTLWVCGGGAFNTFLMERLQANCSQLQVKSTQENHINPQWIEAMAFAWLAKQTIEKKPGNLPSVTGATQETLLGAVYYAF